MTLSGQLATFSQTSRYIQDKLNLSKFRKLYFVDNDGKKQALDVGGYQRQEFEFSNTKTDNPVEFGANLTDTIYRNPIKIRATIIAGDLTPFIDVILDNITLDTSNLNAFKESLLNVDFSSIGDALISRGFKVLDPNSIESNTRSGKIYNQLVDINQNFFQCELITRDRLYKNLQLVRINRVLEMENYNGLLVDIDLDEILTFGATDKNNLADPEVKKNGYMDLRQIADSIF